MKMSDNRWSESFARSVYSGVSNREWNVWSEMQDKEFVFQTTQLNESENMKRKKGLKELEKRV